jgi:hypothetical protein
MRMPLTAPSTGVFPGFNTPYCYYKSFLFKCLKQK